MYVENYGTVVDKVHYKNKVFIVCHKSGIFSLIEHDKVFDITNVIIRCSDIQYVEFKLKEELKK